MLNLWKPKAAGFAVAVAIFALPAIAGAQELELKREFRGQELPQ